MNKETINIFVSGDFAPRLRVADAIEKGNYQSIYNDILPIITDSDISITNLESPLVDNGQSITKTGPNLKAPVKSIEAIKFAGFDMVTLANNHMMDYGDDGLFSTIQACENMGIKHIGAGSNLEEAKKIVYFNVKGKNIAFINCCENEWSTTQGDYPGCNPLNEVALFYQIQEAKSKSDHAIIIIHGGHETYGYPSPRMKKLYRWFIDLGVDAVIGHHTHCFSGFEVYKAKPIVYSLGNFVFDRENRKPSWYVGAAAIIMIQSAKITLKLVPFTQCKEQMGIHVFNEQATNEWLDYENEKSEQIQNDNFLQNEFEKFVATQDEKFSRFLEPNKSSIILAAKVRGLLPKSIRGKKKLLYLNIIRTESHRDILINLLSKK